MIQAHFSFQTDLSEFTNLVSFLQCVEGDSHTHHALYQKTVQAYAGEGRVYHTLPHIGQVLKGITYLVASMDTPLAHLQHLALNLAGWFHDVIYDPRRNDNEEQSAQWMTRELQFLRIPTPIMTQTQHLILTTRSHEAHADDLPAQILLDADLSILGAPADVYARYATAIRQEYAFVPEDAYRARRRTVLERFLSRPKIFHTPPAVAQLEIQARLNLTEEIRALSTPLHQHS